MQIIEFELRPSNRKYKLRCTQDVDSFCKTLPILKLNLIYMKANTITVISEVFKTLII